MRPSDHISEISKKKWMFYSREYSKFSRYAKYRSLKANNPRPIIWVPLDKKEMCGWNVSFYLKPGYHQHERIINLILDHYSNQIHMIKSEKLIRIIRSKGHALHLLKNDLHAYYDRKLWVGWDRSYDGTLLNIYNSKLSRFNHGVLEASLNEKDKEILNKFFNIIKTNYWGKEYLEYFPKLGYGSNRMHIPLDLIKIKVEKTYVTEIGLLDSEWESNYDFLNYKTWSDYSLIKGKPHYGNENRFWYRRLNKTSRRNYRMGMKETLKLNQIDIENSTKEIIRKIYRNQNKKDKCL
jgi:hypothetical protein